MSYQIDIQYFIITQSTQINFTKNTGSCKEIRGVYMKILSVNAGSSSLKFTLFEMPEEKELVKGLFERIGMDGSKYTIKLNGEKIVKEVALPNHEEAFKVLIKVCPSKKKEKEKKVLNFVM